MRDCKAPPHCVNCGGDHPANSKECTAWLREKEIQRLKYTLNLPFAEARKQVEKQTATTYASVIKSTSHSVVCKDASTQTDPLVTPRSTITKPDTRPSSIHTNIPHCGPISAKSSSNAPPSVIARSAPKQKINLEGMGEGGAVGGLFEHPNRFRGLKGLDQDNPTKPPVKPKPSIIPV